MNGVTDTVEDGVRTGPTNHFSRWRFLELLFKPIVSLKRLDLAIGGLNAISR
jgi:hypothetical protein